MNKRGHVLLFMESLERGNMENGIVTSRKKVNPTCKQLHQLFGESLQTRRDEETTLAYGQRKFVYTAGNSKGPGPPPKRLLFFF